MERVGHLTNKIYREMLCIARYERMTYITMGGLDSGSDYIQAGTFFWKFLKERLTCVSSCGHIGMDFALLLNCFDNDGPYHTEFPALTSMIDTRID